jgi:hypothetical protein
MTTHLKQVHEEKYSDGSRTLGVLFNFSPDGEWKESFLYIFHHKNNMYIFFNTMVDMFEYILYADPKVKRAYMEEKEFDEYYDADYLDGKFAEILKWT